MNGANATASTPTHGASLGAATNPAAASAAETFDSTQVTTITLGHAVHDTYTAFLPPLLPVLIDKFSLSNSQAGMLNVFLQWPSLLQPFIGYLADRRNLRALVIIAPAISAVCMSLLGIAPSYAIMAFLLLIVGAGAAGLHSVGPVIAANLSGNQIGRAMGMWMVGGGLGYTVGPLIIVAAIGLVGLEGTPWLMIGGILASVVLYVRLRDVSSLSPTAKAPPRWREALEAMRPLLVPVVGITVVRSFMAAALSTYLPLFLKSEGSNLWFAGAALAIFEGAGMVGSLSAGTISDRIGRRKVLAAAMALASPLMFAFMLTSGLARLPLLIALGFTALAIMPVMMALLQERYPENRAMANGMYLGLSFLSNAAATLALGILADAFSLRVAFTVSAAVPLLGLPLVAMLPGRRKV
jgi:FSR family fosmidomycin resistance protein-like MFS transporter